VVVLLGTAATEMFLHLWEEDEEKGGLAAVAAVSDVFMNNCRRQQR